MNRRTFLTVAGAALPAAAAPRRRTTVSIQGDRFFINGKPTYAGRSYKGMKIEGLLMNSRDGAGHLRRPEPGDARQVGLPGHAASGTRSATRASSSPPCRSGARHGLLAFTVNLQGGSPEGYSKTQPWENSAIDPEGNLRPAYMERLKRILDRADELGMVAIVGYFYFGQDQRVKDEAAVQRAVLNATNWLLERRLPQRAGGDRQRVQRQGLRSRDPQAAARPRTDRAGQRRTRAAAGGCWWAPATAAALPRRPTWSRLRISCCCTATVPTIRRASAT